MGFVVQIDLFDLTDVQEKMCDDYCKMPDMCETQEELDKKCAECPLNNIRDKEYPYGCNDWQE